MPVLLRRLPAIVTALLLAAALLPYTAADDKKQPAPALTITGIITIDGKPLPAGTIRFHPAKGKTFVGPVQPDGSYTIKGVAPGAYRVTITTEAARPAKDKGAPKGKEAPKGEPAKDGARYVPIPPAYRDPRTTPLSVNVQAGKEKQVFDLQLPTR